MIALIIIVLALSVLAILLFPITISFNSVRSGRTINGSLRLSWIIFQYIYYLKEKRSEIYISGHHRSHERRKPEKITIKKRKKTGKMPQVRDILNLTVPILRLIRDLIQAFKIKYFHIDIIYGLNDPANTGILTGFMTAVGCSLKKEKYYKFTPDFTKQVLDWNLRSKASIAPFRIVILLANFVTNKNVLKFALQDII